MPYLVSTELKTHLYAENMNEIARNDATIIDTAIEAGIAEAKSYLGKYNLEKLFNPGATGYFADSNLKNKVKDLVIWQLIAVSNVNINYEVAEKRYDSAIKWLTGVMKGQSDPAGWPLKNDDEDTTFNEGGSISWSSNKKRNNSF